MSCQCSSNLAFCPKKLLYHGGGGLLTGIYPVVAVPYTAYEVYKLCNDKQQLEDMKTNLLYFGGGFIIGALVKSTVNNATDYSYDTY